VSYSFCSSLNSEINLVTSLAFAFKTRRRRCLQFDCNIKIERNCKKLNVLHFEKMWIKICHLEKEKVEFGQDFFKIIVQ